MSSNPPLLNPFAPEKQAACFLALNVSARNQIAVFKSVLHKSAAVQPLKKAQAHSCRGFYATLVTHDYGTVNTCLCFVEIYCTPF